MWYRGRSPRQSSKKRARFQYPSLRRFLPQKAVVDSAAAVAVILRKHSKHSACNTTRRETLVHPAPPSPSPIPSVLTSPIPSFLTWSWTLLTHPTPLAVLEDRSHSPDASCRTLVTFLRNSEGVRAPPSPGGTAQSSYNFLLRHVVPHDSLPGAHKDTSALVQASRRADVSMSCLGEEAQKKAGCLRGREFTRKVRQ